MGSYQAGFLYYLSEFKKRNDLALPSLVTSASAGSINSLISMAHNCMGEVSAPQESLFWQSWIPIGLEELVVEEDVGRINIFSRDAIELAASRVKGVWQKGLPRNCQVIMGVSVTRKNALRVKMKEGLEFIKQKESFVFRVEGLGEGRLPYVENLSNPDNVFSEVALPFGEHPEKSDFELIKDVIFASASMPLAFKPMEISHCLLLREDRFRRCTFEKAKTEPFIDGGLFDSDPLRLAYQISQFESSLKAEDPDESLQFTFVDGGSPAYPEVPEEDRQKPKKDGIFRETINFVGNIITKARRGELSILLQEHPELVDDVFNSVNYLPLAGSLIGSFSGFLDEDFRKFDFYQGMYNARRFISQNIVSENPERDWLFPEQPMDKRWRPFLCLLSLSSERDNFKSLCELGVMENEFRNIRILFQVSLNRLFTICRRLPPDTQTNHRLCQQAMSGEVPPVVIDEFNMLHWERKSSDDSEFLYMLRLLAEYGYEFKDLGLRRDQSHLAIRKIIQKFTQLGYTLADKQDLSDELALQAVLKPSANFAFGYTPTRRIYYLALGSGLELGMSHLFAQGDGAPRWLRYNLAAYTQGFESLMGTTDTAIAITPLAGPEFELLPLSGSTVQTRFGLRGGYQFSSGDIFSDKLCEFERNGPVYSCSAWTLQPQLNIGVMERFRFQTNAQFFPFYDRGHRPFQVSFQIGFQFLGRD